MEDNIKQIELFEKVFQADIINKIEPLYSVATAVAEYWSEDQYNNVMVKLLLKRLLANWENCLRNHIKSYKVAGNQIQLSDLSDFKKNYKNNKIITDMINKILVDILDIPQNYPQPIW